MRKNVHVTHKMLFHPWYVELVFSLSPELTVINTKLNICHFYKWTLKSASRHLPGLPSMEILPDT